MKGSRMRMAAVLTAAALLVGACGGTAAPSAAPSAAASASAKAYASPATGKIGGTVTVLATWGGDEKATFLEMIKPFEDQTGITVNYTGTRDLNAVLSTDVQAGNPPDLAGLPGPGQMAEFARAGKLIDLSKVLDMSAVKKQYAQTWLDLGTVDGKLVGVFIDASVKGLIWYDPKNFAAKSYQIPKTWDDMMKLSDTIKSGGTAPWCVGLESGAASGWPGTDWLEDIVLRQNGPKLYEDWYNGKVKWTSPEITKAWQTWSKIVATPGMSYGGSNYMLTTNFGKAADPLFTTPPGCYMHHQASFITSFIQKDDPKLVAGTDYSFFPFPDIEPKYSGSLEVAGDLFGMFKDTPQSRALMKYLATPQAQEVWMKQGGKLSANKEVPLSVYPDKLTQDAAKLLTSSKTAVFDASDNMPDTMNKAFWKAILDYVRTPSSLQSILKNLDDVQASAYTK